MTNKTTELRTTIKNMLDNSILDWNRPSQLTDISAEANYNKLIPEIIQLIEKTVLDVIGQAGSYPISAITASNTGLTNSIELQGMNKLRASQRSHLDRILGK